jgi:hypothetical protein
MSPETFTARNTRLSNEVTHFAAVLLVSTIKRVVSLTRDTQCTLRLSSDGMITEYTHDEYCNVQGKSHHIIPADVIQMLVCFDEWSSVSVRQEL